MTLSYESISKVLIQWCLNFDHSAVSIRAMLTKITGPIVLNVGS
jgi:hypothetical protein